MEIIHSQFHQSIVYQYIDDILLAYSNVDTLERMFEKVKKKKLPFWGLQTDQEKLQRGYSIISNIN